MHSSCNNIICTEDSYRISSLLEQIAKIYSFPPIEFPRGIDLHSTRDDISNDKCVPIITQYLDAVRTYSPTL